MSKSQVKRKNKKIGSAETPPESRSLTDQATRTVRNHILDLTLSPGMTLDERYLLERFEFGRTPMREALNRLIVEGLVVSRGPRGVQVAPLNIEATVELFDAYVMSERMVASALKFNEPNLLDDLEQLQGKYERNLDESDLLRVTELNALFHNRLAAATQNAFIRDYSYKLHNLARRLSYFIYKREASQEDFASKLFDRPRRDHLSIIDAIRTADRKHLIDLLTDHAVFFRTRLARIINEDHSAEIDFTEFALQK